MPKSREKENQNTSVQNQSIDLASFLGGNPYYNTGTTAANPAVVTGTGSSGVTADMILSNPNFRPEDIDKLNFDQNGNLIIDTTGLQQLGIGPLTSLGKTGQSVEFNQFMGGGTTPPDATTPQDTTTSETVPVAPVAPVTPYVNPYVQAMSSMTPTPTPAEQFNNLMRTMTMGVNKNPYVQPSGIASALPLGSI